MPVACTLCKTDQTKAYAMFRKREFTACTNCGCVFVNPTYYISKSAEKERYLQHQNDVNDQGYQSFVMPIVNEITSQFNTTERGLDFGAGTGPVVAKLLEEKGYSIKLWDPFFHPTTTVLEETYNFIICCEVIEHMHHPLKAFKEIHMLLKPNGKLYCKTQLLPEKSNFEKWFYKNDLTHVIFYTPKSLQWIVENTNFIKVSITDDLIIFE